MPCGQVTNTRITRLRGLVFLAAKRSVEKNSHRVVTCKRLGGHFTKLQLKPLLNFPPSQSPVDFVYVGFDTVESPADGGVEGESVEPFEDWANG